MDPVSLTAFLAPFLARLLAGVQDSVEDAGREVGSEAWAAAKRLWGKLRPKVDETPGAADAAEKVATAPDDDLARGALAFQLRELLAGDDALRDEVEQIWRETEPARVAYAAERGVAVAGDVTGSTIVTGDNVDVGG